ncbi:hypothetical protein CTI12_AA386060 [Artemisia annua]|uniref:Uncharacterized protein n=1 Tax=Artemisia annua TaxID=35608 RepID=A0A2U1MF32_ARTAN|nr:hypothetical protein CTI12_AA386060 [Artemisia annua]
MSTTRRIDGMPIQILSLNEPLKCLHKANHAIFQLSLNGCPLKFLHGSPQNEKYGQVMTDLDEVYLIISYSSETSEVAPEVATKIATEVAPEVVPKATTIIVTVTNIEETVKFYIPESEEKETRTKPEKENKRPTIGLTEFAHRRNQESTSDVVNVYYSPALMGLAYGDKHLVLFVGVLWANKRDSGLWFAPSEWKECRTGIQVLPLLLIELGNKLKERAQMSKKRLKIWDPGIKIFLDNTLRRRWFLKGWEVLHPCPWLEYVS